VSDVSIPVCINGVWPLLRFVSAAQNIKSVDHVFQRPIHRPPDGLHSLTALGDETIEWLLNTSPRSSATKQWTERTRSNDGDDEAACACVL